MTEATARPERDSARTQRERRVFWIILWISCAASLVAHITEEDRSGSPLTAAGLIMALAVWLHGVHQFFGLTRRIC